MTPQEDGEKAVKRIRDKIKTAKIIKAINPDRPKNSDGTTFYENLHPKHKGKHRKED